MADKNENVVGHAVWDNDAKQLALAFVTGTQAEQKDAAQTHLEGLLGHTGEAPERELEVVKLVVV